MDDQPQKREISQGTQQLKILVVDDSRDAVEMLEMLLETFGYMTAHAYDGADALKVAKEFLPDVILLDIGLPGTSGYQVAKELRKEPEFATTRIIALTGYGQLQDKEKAEEAGFDHHFVKPVEISKLVELLQSAQGTPR